MKINNKQRRKGFTLVELLVVISIIVALGALATPALLRQRKKADMLQGVNNARQVYFLLAEFDQDFGAYPNETIAGNDTEEFTAPGNDSNGYMQMLIDGGYVESEEIFFCKGEGITIPDNVITEGNALDTGECGFTYVTEQSSSKNGGRPILTAPNLDDTDTEFDTDTFDRKAVVLRIDGSTKTERISRQGEVKVGDGKGLFETGEDTVWGSSTNIILASPDRN